VTTGAGVGGCQEDTLRVIFLNQQQ